MIRGKNVEVVGFIGNGTEIGENVKFEGFGAGVLQLKIGENVRIDDNVRIIASGLVALEDNVTLHHHVTILGPGNCFIDKNTWIAQYTVLDATGDLEIGKNCCIGYNCQIWSHRGRVPKLGEYAYQTSRYPDFKKKTIIGDDVWLMGGLITISPGVHLGRGSVVLSNSVVTESTKICRTYAGAPAKLQKGVI